MRTHLARQQAALVLLLVGSGLLFAIGSTIERHQHHNEPAAAGESPGERGGESGETGSGESSAHAVRSQSDADATILGVNTESVALTVVAFAASLLLALAVWLGRRPRLVLFCVAGFGLVFAAGDARELVHQLDESNAALAAVAAFLIVLHLTVTALAAALFPRRGSAGGLATVGPLN